MPGRLPRPPKRTASSLMPILAQIFRHKESSSPASSSEPESLIYLSGRYLSQRAFKTFKCCSCLARRPNSGVSFPKSATGAVDAYLAIAAVHKEVADKGQAKNYAEGPEKRPSEVVFGSHHPVGRLFSAAMSTVYLDLSAHSRRILIAAYTEKNRVHRLMVDSARAPVLSTLAFAASFTTQQRKRRAAIAGLSGRHQAQRCALMVIRITGCAGIQLCHCMPRTGVVARGPAQAQAPAARADRSRTSPRMRPTGCTRPGKLRREGMLSTLYNRQAILGGCVG